MPQIESLGLFGAIGTNTGDEGGLKVGSSSVLNPTNKVILQSDADNFA